MNQIVFPDTTLKSYKVISHYIREVLIKFEGINTLEIHRSKSGTRDSK